MSVRVEKYIQPLAFGSCLYMRYNTAAHVLYITSNTHEKCEGVHKGIPMVYCTNNMFTVLFFNGLCTSNMFRVLQVVVLLSYRSHKFCVAIN